MEGKREKEKDKERKERERNMPLKCSHSLRVYYEARVLVLLLPLLTLLLLLYFPRLFVAVSVIILKSYMRQKAWQPSHNPQHVGIASNKVLAPANWWFRVNVSVNNQHCC